MSTTVVNIHDYEGEVAKIPNGVYIGRGSKWGNPFPIGKDGSRAEVITKYIAYLLRHQALLDALPELKDKMLVCFCAPLACHGDVLARYADAPYSHGGIPCFGCQICWGRELENEHELDEPCATHEPRLVVSGWQLQKLRELDAPVADGPNTTNRPRRNATTPRLADDE